MKNIAPIPRTSAAGRLSGGRSVIIIWTIILFGALLEIGQALVPLRDPPLRDGPANSLGALLGGPAVRKLHRSPAQYRGFLELKERDTVKESMKTKIISFILGSLFTIAALYVFTNFPPSTQQEAENVTSEAANPIKEPTLSLPLSYFRREDLGSSTGEKTQLDGGYRSHPATTITFIDFRNTDEALPDMPDEEEWTSLTDEMTAYSSLYAAQHQAHGEIGKRYAGKMQDIDITEADVTSDGIPEKILWVSDVGGNHRPHLYHIVQNERIIFEAGVSTSLLRDIDPHPTQNGFILEWAGEKHLEGRGLCCPRGYTATRFVFEDGEFVPIYEQDNRYFQVENSDE